MHDPGQDASVGLPPDVGGAESPEDFIAAGLAALGIEADDVEIAVMGVAHGLFWPAIVELLERDLGEVEPEPWLDLSRGPA